MQPFVYFFLATIVVSAFAQPSGAEELPARKAGLWEITITSAQLPKQIIKQCADEATDRQMMQMGMDLAAGKTGVQCAKNETTKQGGHYTIETDCMMGPMRLVSKAVFSGDFSSQYTGELSARYDPPLMGMSQSKTTMTAKWLGPCQAGQRPGDMIMSDGTSIDAATLKMLGGTAYPTK